MKEKTAKIAKIESFGLLDGPGVRTVIFFQGCSLRCAFCHNPLMVDIGGGTEITVSELFEKVLKFKPYYKKTGGVTASGGEPLLQIDFLIEFFKKCKENNIHTCLDTAGVGIGNYDELLKWTDLVIFDIKHTDPKKYKELTLCGIEKSEEFIKALVKNNKDVWIRQVIIPNYNDNDEYLKSLADYIKSKFKINISITIPSENQKKQTSFSNCEKQEATSLSNIKKIEFLPYHTMATNLYEENKIPYRLKGVPSMNSETCKKLEEKFLKEIF